MPADLEQKNLRKAMKMLSVDMWHKEFGGDDGPIFCYRKLEPAADGTLSISVLIGNILLTTLFFLRLPIPRVYVNPPDLWSW